ncbi:MULTISPECIES: flagellar basal-body MS-ring/collar protein FliF [Azorhizobium]|uniref:Flagellar M-ring protein n=1 Tax=Azorhizobium caulinodans (strain ATCC 43989 / DSM 5975 / JCM 20966 / LMG 6465 / NBRC 14845 / NCIMB 13405 / ORS 571) TaxID=438753 RepID=A8IPI8_AZOC5|nr:MULTISPECIES: flagellar basal-body MS-ring/collar protein FliF [Azorhizobium]TDT88901.1 flagellar M-ring protein FliF [Azorhizobium sp. AG788]BAF86625.1 flagellar M-ring protein [Azorhizobium caulinodans ORS 571]
MNAREQLERLLSNLRQLGARRLVALGLIAFTVMAVIGLGAMYLSQPERETLYANLSRDDVTRIGGALKDAGIPFDVSSDGATVLVAHSDTARARMLLAVKGLPQSSSSGYELFNDVRSFGLTSFMQEVTKVRALEGEIARTIQTMKGIKAARVHIVLPDRGSFRRDQQLATASVVIRTENSADSSTAQAIRHLVAAAIPGMKLDNVTVLNTEGTILTSTEDGVTAAATRKSALQQQVNRETEEKIRRTLTPFLGLGNFEVSVSSRLNTDRSTINETTYDPASKAERSTRVVKEQGQTQNRSQQPNTTVQQNIPPPPGTPGTGTENNENNQRREELTNFEISTRQSQTVRDAYSVENLSIAVLVNKERLTGTKDGTPLETQTYEIEQLVSSAAGFDKERGDKLKVVAVPFADGGNNMEPIPPLTWSELLFRQAGTIVNAVTILVVAILLIWFGLRPALRAILARPEPDEAEAIEAAMLAAPTELPPDTVLPSTAQNPNTLDGVTTLAGFTGGDSGPVNLIGDVTSKVNRSPQRRLEQMIEYDEEQAAAILRQWLHQEAKA